MIIRREIAKFYNRENKYVYFMRVKFYVATTVAKEVKYK